MMLITSINEIHLCITFSHIIFVFLPSSIMSEKYQRQDSHHTECLMFIDESNLWIEGKTVHASKLKLTDADKDPRFRIDYGKLVELLIEDRYMSKCFIYGSNPCLIDTIWKIEEKYNFIVKTFERSCIGKEKEVDVAMVCDMLQSLYESPNIDNVTFIVITGDRDFKQPVEIILEKGVQVELWSWEHSLAKEYTKMTNKYFSVKTLDTIKENFSFTFFMSTRPNKEINPDCAVVFRNVPADERFLNKFTNNIASIRKLFFVTKKGMKSGKQDLILEFPNTPIYRILEYLACLKRPKSLECESIIYKEYIDQEKKKHSSQELEYSVKVTNRYEILTTLNDEKLPSEATETIDVPEYSRLASKDASEDSHLYDLPSLPDEDKPERCSFGDHCARGLDCSYQHTEEEKQLFSKNIPNYQFRKTRRCKSKHLTPEEQERCNFAHSSKEAWCLKCKKYGHFTHD